MSPMVVEPGLPHARAAPQYRAASQAHWSRPRTGTEAPIPPAAGRDRVMLDLVRLCLSRTHAAPPGSEGPGGRPVGRVGTRSPHAGTYPRRTIKMPLPQVNDRLKEIPAQALRTVFATIGQVLLVADRLRAKAAGQLPGSGETTATRPADQAPTPAPPSPARQASPTSPTSPTSPASPARPAAGNSRWRSLDKTGNVRVLDGGEEEDDEDVPRVSKAVPEPAPASVPSAEYTPTEAVP